VDSQVKEAGSDLCKAEREVVGRNTKHLLRNAIHIPFGAKSYAACFGFLFTGNQKIIFQFR